jgi:hypothetical protein
MLAESARFKLQVNTTICFFLFGLIRVLTSIYTDDH